MKVLYKLNFTYFKQNKKSYISIFIGILLSTFLLMSVFIAIDSYKDFNIRTNAYKAGSWEVSFSVNQNNENKICEFSDFVYKTEVPLTYQDQKFMPVVKVSKYNDLLGFHLLEGGYPDAEKEVVIDDEFAHKEAFQIGDDITFLAEDGTDVRYKVAGIYERLVVQQNPIFYIFHDKNDESIKQGTIYGILKDPSQIQFYMGSNTSYHTNETLIHAKYGSSRVMETLSFVAALAILICAIFFLFNTFQIQVEKKKHYLHQLHLLGMTKKQIRTLLSMELFFAGIIAFLLSLIISYGLWYLIINSASSFIARLFNTNIKMYCILTSASFIKLILYMALAYILTISFTFIKLLRHKQKIMRYRNVTLRKFSITSRMGILDVIRRRRGVSICLSIFIGVVLIMCTQYTLRAWLADKKEHFAQYTNAIEANFALYDVTLADYEQFRSDTEKFCEQRINKSCNILYEVGSSVALSNDPRKGILLSINDEAFTAFVKEQNISDISKPILLNRFYIMQGEEKELIKQQVPADALKLDISLMNMTNEVYSRFEDTANVVNADIYPNRKESDQLIFLCSQAYIQQILKDHPGGQIRGEFKVNTDQANDVEESMSRAFHLKGNDYVYVQNNAKQARIYFDTEMTISLFLYSFIGIIIILCFANIYNVLYQYFHERRKERILLRAIGMLDKQWKKQIFAQIIFYAGIGLFAAHSLALIINYFLYKRLLYTFVETYHVSYISIIISCILCIGILYCAAWLCNQRLENNNK